VKEAIILYNNIKRQEAIFDGSNKKRVNFVRQLAEADAEYYSVLKDEFKNKTPTPCNCELVLINLPCLLGQFFIMWSGELQ
jgi:hypothetical protein